MTRKHDVLILTQCFPPDVGGIENMMGALADALAAAGNDVTVLADGAAEAAGGRFAYPVRRFDGFKPLRRWRKGRAAERILRSGRIGVIIADSWKSLEHLRTSVIRRAGCTVLVLAHGMEFPIRLSERKAARIRAAFDKADEIVANSRYTASQCAPYRRRSLLRVATPPIPPQPDPGAARVESLRQAHGGALNVLTLCRLEPRKGVDRLIEATAALRAEFPRIRLHVAGGGPDRERLQARAGELGLDTHVVFHGRVSDEDKAALYAFADIFAMPARREGSSVEGFGIVYLEAAWYGTPSIAGTEGGASDAVQDGETGLLCDGQDPAAVTAVLRAMAADPDLRGRLGANAGRVARRQIWENRLADYLPSRAKEPTADVP
jgi:glycosyltransferase involved in cell wall biosynthesis